MAVVKADGFGHGMLDVARTALRAGATRLGGPRWRRRCCCAPAG
jgi:alanine racemase